MVRTEARLTLQCSKCGGKTLSLPDQPTDESVVRCDSCGTEMGTLGDLKAVAVETVKKGVKKELKTMLRYAFKRRKNFRLKE